MNRNNIQNNYPATWVCGAKRTQDGMTDSWVTQDGFEEGKLVTCQRCIQIIKKYGEK